MKNRIITGIYFALLGALISAGPQSIFKVCEPTSDKVMKCLWTATAEIGVGIVIVLLGIFLLALKSSQARLGVSISVAFMGILAALFPTVLIGVCPKVTMRCHMLTLPALLVLSVFIVLGALINCFYLYKISKKDIDTQ